MNTRMNGFPMLVLSLAAFAAMMFFLLQATIPGKQVPVAVERAAEAPLVVEAPAAVALRAPMYRTEGMTLSLTKVRQQPNEDSAVIDILTPHQTVRVMGSSAEGSWLAVGGDERLADQGQPEGWVSRADVAMARTYGYATGASVVLEQPKVDARIIEFFAPARQVEVVGVTQDGQYYAIRLSGSNSTGYVQASNLELDPQIVQTERLTKVYQAASENSPVVTVLPPVRQVELLGLKVSDGWAAVGGLDRERFNGYARLSDLKITNPLTDAR